jgi:hypothetical protein
MQLDVSKSDQLSCARGKSVTNFVAYCAQVDPWLQYAAERLHDSLQPEFLKA